MIMKLGKEHYELNLYTVYDPELIVTYFQIIIKGSDPLRAKKTFIRKKLGQTAVSVIKASSVTL